MSITPTTGYMSNDEIMAWMEQRTDDLYTNMRDAMSGASNRADAEAALDQIKAALQNSSGKDATQVTQMINDAIAKYPDVPEVAKVLQPMADKLNGEFSTAQAQATQAQLELASNQAVGSPRNLFAQATVQSLKDQATVKVNIDSGDSDTWGKQIDSTVQDLGKEDQLDMINIQEFNSEINQAKQTASALMDASDKSSEAVISHIS
jgi:hypothetical protein